MKQELYYCKHIDCQICKDRTERTDRGFKHIESKKGEKYVFEILDTYTMVFILSGEALISCNEFTDIHFHTGQIVLWPMSSNCVWETIEDTACIVLAGDTALAPCDRKALKEHADLWLDTDPAFKALEIKPRLMDFLATIKNYLDDGITCPYMHKTKQQELSVIFRAYYPQQELMDFFLPTLCNTHEFEHFIMNNYLKMKGVKEFVDSSGMNISTFNRKFRAHFKQSPYQWLIKQKSKHIYYALSQTTKSFTAIAREFHFTDASHFNRYCKAKFGASPSQIRNAKTVQN